MDGRDRPRLPEALLNDLADWLDEDTRGRPARPLARAIVSYAGGANLSQLMSDARAEGLTLTEGEFAVELARALRWVRRHEPRFAPLLAAARACLGTAVEGHLVVQGLMDPCWLEVVMDQAFGVWVVHSALRLGVSVETVRTIRRQAVQRYGNGPDGPTGPATSRPQRPSSAA